VLEGSHDLDKMRYKLRKLEEDSENDSKIDKESNRHKYEKIRD
tara:strand:+ start:85 stop:213 length:129 start_codon:yes stop_codon:yes gene_type:complete